MLPENLTPKAFRKCYQHHKYLLWEISGGDWVVPIKRVLYFHWSSCDPQKMVNKWSWRSRKSRTKIARNSWNSWTSNSPIFLKPKEQQTQNWHICIIKKIQNIITHNLKISSSNHISPRINVKEGKFILAISNFFFLHIWLSAAIFHLYTSLPSLQLFRRQR
jgi:hypothetical protein